MNSKETREKLQVTEYVSSGLGKEKMKDRIERIMPGIDVHVRYPPKEKDCDISLIRLKPEFKKANTAWEEKFGEKLYDSFDDFLYWVKQFIWGEYTQDGIYTNITYPSEVVTEQIRQISFTKN